MAKISRPCTLLLRILATAAAISATAVMASSHQTTTIYNLTLKAEFNQSPSFMFFLAVYAVASLYSLLALFIPQKGIISSWVILFDVMIAMLMMAAMGAAGAVSHLGKKGNMHAGWMPICEEFTGFCNHVLGALISGFIALLLYTMIIFHTIIIKLNPLLQYENN